MSLPKCEITENFVSDITKTQLQEKTVLLSRILDANPTSVCIFFETQSFPPNPINLNTNETTYAIVTINNEIFHTTPTLHAIPTLPQRNRRFTSLNFWIFTIII